MAGHIYAGLETVEAEDAALCSLHELTLEVEELYAVAAVEVDGLGAYEPCSFVSYSLYAGRAEVVVVYSVERDVGAGYCASQNAEDVAVPVADL